MARSVRISDSTYALAMAEAKLMSRSLAQQLEHWAKLGRALERSGVSTDDVRSIALMHRHAIDAQDVAEGRRDASTLHFIPAATVRSFALSFPDAAFAEFADRW